ncbi:TetR/AcrR family transcriptional regulator [Enterococcus sp. ALS3]|uniref:TetR/AcrR family transcriptional regulator n=1 Tax=Enterococcus alishanensis TaxID=1303817 RepID=A0ABS6TC70_9ENTE|nr:TetR/AcrR family transcriptional regulator [Enterococcus alishanensis]MBV7390494.1 TetR/AcrR family transcriptional regulator [Enterococcus alishanensis]
MTENKVIRKPLQKRALEKKAKILATARKLFSERNFFNVSTNEIAKEAGLSIGTLYAYYNSKEDILIELVEEYHKTFLTIFAEINQSQSFELFKTDTQKWLVNLINRLISVEDEAFHQEIEMLAMTVPEVKKVVREQQNKMKHLTYEHFLYYANQSNPQQIKILSTIIFDFITSLVDEVLYSEHTEKEAEEIISAGVAAIDLLIKAYLT